MKIIMFKAFRSRNYRLFFLGQSVSLMGTWMQRTAVYWIIYAQTHSAFMLGLAAFAIQFPAFMLSLVGGAVADRYSRYKVLLITQIASMIQAALLTGIVLFTHYSVVEILVLSVFLGIINAFDVPARQSLVPSMVDSEDLSNAIALNSSMSNLARLIGPAISGIILETLGVGICFMMNTLSFIAVIVSLFMMKIPPFVPEKHALKIRAGMKEGLKYLRATPSIGVLVIQIALMSLLVMPFTTMLPVIAKTILHGNAATYGYLNSAVGVGALAGAIFLASIKPQINRKKILVIVMVIFAMGLILFSCSHTLVVSLFFLSITGFGMMAQVTLINTLLQMTSSKEMRGRVMSFFAMGFLGMQPLGALLIGSVSHYVGTPEAILFQGIIAVLITTIFFPFLWRNILFWKKQHAHNDLITRI